MQPPAAAFDQLRPAPFVTNRSGPQLDLFRVDVDARHVIAAAKVPVTRPTYPVPMMAIFMITGKRKHFESIAG
jgi:hypothetical protein